MPVPNKHRNSTFCSTKCLAMQNAERAHIDTGSKIMYMSKPLAIVYG